MHSRPVKRLQGRPARENEREAFALEAARRCCHYACEMHETPRAPQFSQQIQILKNRKRLKAADLLVGFAPHEKRRIAVTQSKAAQSRIQARHKTRRRFRAVKLDGKIAANRPRVFQCLCDSLRRVNRQNRVRMKKQKNIAACGTCARVHLRAAPALRVY